MQNNDAKVEVTEFKGRRTLVTGGTKGIGAAIVDRLLRGGAEVIAAARSASQVTPADRFVQADVSTRAGIESVVKAVTDRFNGLDVLIHNVGGSAARGGGALALSDDDWQHAFDTNLFAAVRLDRALLPSMLEQGSGVIIHISSIQRTLPLFDATLAYAAAKAALTNYSKGLSKEVSSKGIRVNSVAPGYTETDAAVGMVNEIGTERASARMLQGNASWIHLAVSRWAGRIDLMKSQSWWRFWHRIVLLRSPGANTSSTVEQFQRCKLGATAGYRGEAASIASGVHDATGTAPRSFDDFAHDYASAFSQSELV